MLRPGPGHDGDGGYPLHRVLESFLVGGYGHHPDILVRGTVGAGEHLCHTLFGRQNNGQTVGPAAFQKEAVEIFFGIRFEQTRPLRSLHGFAVLLCFRQRLGEGEEYLFREGNIGNGVVTGNIASHRFPGNKPDRVGREGPAQVHAVTAAVALYVVRKAGGDDRGRGHSVIVLQRPGKFGDTRRTAVSAADADDSGVTVCLDFGP